jgi:hypothetical protein
MGLSELLILAKQTATDKNILPDKIEAVCETLIKTGCTYHSLWQTSIDLFQRSSSDTQ